MNTPLLRPRNSYGSLSVVALMFAGALPLTLALERVGHTAVTTEISPTGRTGSPASLGTTITSGTSTVSTNLCAANCVITGGTRAGTNLFQSFGLFSVGGGDTATFQNTQVNGAFPLTTNILSRVTDGQCSQIFGTLRTADFGNANLFLMNPAGIVFGPNATLDVGGSVAFTTAGSIKLKEIPGPPPVSGVFHADPAKNSVLTTAAVESFGFLGPTVAPITVYGMTVQGPMPIDPDTGAPLGQKVKLVGGLIKFTSDPASGTPSIVKAPGRQIQITSVAGVGEVAADTLIPSTSMALGTITLGQGTLLSTAGDSSFGDGSGGSISIRGGQFVATEATIFTSPASSSTGSGGDVTVNVTGSATITDSTFQTSDSLLSVFSPVGFAGPAGAVSIAADESLTITNSVIDTSTFVAFGDSGSVTLMTSGPLSVNNSKINAASGISGNAGAVTATGKNVTLDGVTISADVTGDESTGLTVHSGAVTLTATDTATGMVKISNSSITNISDSALLDGRPVTITGTTINIQNNSTIDTTMRNSTLISPANGGTIEIHSSNANVTGSHLASFGDGLSKSTGRGGNIRFAGTDGVQSADNIQLTATEVNSSSTSGGGGGTIEFQTKALIISDHTDVGTSSFGQGSGGTVTIRGAKNVTVESGSRVLTDVVIGAPLVPQGSAGDILFETQHLAVLSGGQIGARALPNSTGNAGNITVHGHSPAQSILIDGAGSGIFTNTQGTGAGGNITLTANEVTIQNGGTVSASTSGNAVTARGGDITIVASRSVELNSGASISASSTGAGNAGNITINAGKIFEARNSSVTTKSEHAGGGNVAINATDRFRLVNSHVNASAFINGGNISIDPNLVVLQNSQILAQAIQGNGGNITITTPLFLADSSSLVSASSQFGLNGTVTIQSPTSNLSGSLGTLSSKPNQAQSLLTQRCAALANGQASSFVVAGREQLPADPGGWLSGPIALAGIDAERFGEGAVAESTSHLAPRTSGFLANDRVSLRRLTPAGFLIANFADSEATGCHS